ncbi:MAG: HTTM domain-containing protein [Flavobacteriales bacterium]|nr:HTTM domain-containing protein [Flavobacteriales bacterium]
MNRSTIRLFQRALYLWLAGYVLSALPEADRMWQHPVSPVTQGAWIADLVAALPGSDRWAGLPAALLLLGMAAYGLWREPPRWMALTMVVLYTALLHRSWLAATGGHWLMANVLLWNVALRARPSAPAEACLAHLGFLAIRLQLCLAYVMSGLNKLAGTCWLDGTALLRVAGDEAYDPRALLHHPAVAATLGHGVLVLLLMLPIALWVPSLRRTALITALLFHLVSGFWFHIPDMALAFCAVLICWTSQGEAQAVERATTRCKALVFRRLDDVRAGSGIICSMNK